MKKRKPVVVHIVVCTVALMAHQWRYSVTDSARNHENYRHCWYTS